MMKIKFDKDRFLKLWTERKNLRKEGIWEYDKAKEDELVSYLIMIEDQFFWESRNEYSQILDLFIRKKITPDQFFTQFSHLRRSNATSVRMWEDNLEEEAFGGFPKSTEVNIHFNPNSCGFTKIISYLQSLVDLHDPDVTLSTNLNDVESVCYGISDEFLRIMVEEAVFPKLEKYCTKS